ncbi:MAG TPA: MoxR family ATPase [Polyangiaceae bacterium]|nr:MoxR family ATPase [Polyangiaceae bacterium]
MSAMQGAEERLEEFERVVRSLQSEMARVIVGQKDVVEGVITCLLAGSHVLLEGVPGLGKTLLVRTLAQLLELPFARIQFTPDLMPADILGTTVVTDDERGGARFEFKKGPIFAPIVLADEVNRATPKTQSALLEAMQEHRVTLGNVTHDLGQPYLVLATQNPLEMEGTYPLPEAQLDRFFFKLRVPFPSHEELLEIMGRTTGSAEVSLSPVADRELILSLQRTVRDVPVPAHVLDYVARLVRATHADLPLASPSVRRFVATGASPRGAQALVVAAKIRALLAGRVAASLEDVKRSALPALRHRLLLNFEGEAEGMSTDAVIGELLETLPDGTP